MNEIKNVARKFFLTVVWIFFVLLTLTGIVSAGERTEYINSGKEPQTVKLNNNLSER